MSIRLVTSRLTLGAALIALSGLIGSLPAALATTFFERPFKESVAGAPVIVRGVVTGSYADWSGSKGDQRLFTFYDLQVSEVFKGQVNGRTIMMREMGGEKDGIGMQVAGAARFEKGDDVVVFLGTRNPDASYSVRGMMMGRYDIAKDENDREYLVGSGVDGGKADDRQHHDDHHEHSGLPSGDVTPLRRWTLSDLRELVREQESELQKRPEISKTNSGAPAPAELREKPEQAAPQLQTSSSAESAPAEAEAGENEGLPVWPAIILGGLGAFGALILFLRRSRRG